MRRQRHIRIACTIDLENHIYGKAFAYLRNFNSRLWSRQCGGIVADAIESSGKLFHHPLVIWAGNIWRDQDS
ncbi:MAG: hypothetical protein A2V79_06175 [Betaproteobacteria bacterium RBG_16_56_24]|nr:MAG: hypothetical protein A2V79_06175 [Betaproteobacteria bacterium RBG_16_56_24]